MLLDKSGFDSYMVGIMLDMGCEWTSFDTIPATRSIFNALVKYLVYLRSKEDVTHSIVLRNDFKDNDSEIIFAASLEKNKSDEGTSYSLTFTCDPEDIPKDSKLINIADREAFEFISKDMEQNPRDSFTINSETGGAYNLYCALRGIVINLKEFGRKSLNSDDNVIELKGFFTVTATVDEGGKVHIKITPTEELKQLIKDDSTIEGNKKKDSDTKPEDSNEQLKFQA